MNDAESIGEYVERRDCFRLVLAKRHLSTSNTGVTRKSKDDKHLDGFHKSILGTKGWDRSMLRDRNSRMKEGRLMTR